ncbi:MAG: EamA family transporter RarD [Roseovarius sp.]
MSELTKGVIASILACILWGVSGLFYDQITHIPALEVMAHRTVWSLVFFTLLLMLQRRALQPIQVLRDRRVLGIIAMATFLVGINWLVFVYAIQIGKALEASLGYFIYPLVSIVLGLVVFRERLTGLQWLAVVLVAAAVLTLSLGLGLTPWLALLLAVSFGLYGMIKKGLEVGPIVSVTAEAALLTPPALVVLWLAHQSGDAGFGASWHDSVYLILAGPMTATPLMLFSYASQRISMTSIGLVHYLNPTLQFLVATLILQEPFGLWHALAFAMIWTALVIYSTTIWHQSNTARRAS